MKDLLHEMLTGLARWPLLMGAPVCFAFAVYEEMVTDSNEIALAIAGTVIGCVLLGGWLVSYVIEGERRHNERWSQQNREPSGDRSEEGVVVDQDIDLGRGDGGVTE